MSGHGAKHGSGSPSNSSSQKSVPSKQQGGKRSKELKADFLLNFQGRPPSHQRPAAYAPPARRSRPSGRQRAPMAYVRGRFVQSSFRLFVDSATMDVLEASLSADVLIDWPNVRRVDLLCDDHPKCPICLERQLVVPKITRCGHIFCMPCIMRYFILLQGHTVRASQRCPVCNEQVSPEDLTSVRFQMTRALQEDQRLSFVLVYREASAISVRASASAAMAVVPPAEEGEAEEVVAEAFQKLPTEQEAGWHFSRLVRLRPGEYGCLLRQEVEALQLYRPVAIRAGDTELLPSIDAAVSLLDLQRGSAPAGEFEPAPIPEPSWGCRYVQIPNVADRSGLSTGVLAAAANIAEATDELEYDGAAAGPDEGLPPESPCASAQPSPYAGAMSSPSTSCLPSPLLEPTQLANGSSSPSLEPSAHGNHLQLDPLPEPRTGAVCTGGARIISFYQATDGRLVFLQPFFTKLLLHEHGGRWDQLPACLVDLRLERLHELTVTEEVRKRYRFLSHLPLGSPAWFGEVDLRGQLSKETKDTFVDEFAKRRQQRLKDKAKSRREERHSKHMAAEQEEQYYRSLNRSLPFTAVAPPTKEDFAVDLLGREVEVSEEAVPVVETDGVAGDRDAADGVEEDSAGPTLADKIKEKMATKAKTREDANYFPLLGGSNAGAARGNSTAASAWGAGKGSSKARGSLASGSGSGANVAEAAEEEPTFGEVLEAALLSASSRTAQQTAEAAEAEGEVVAASDSAGSSRKKKGRAAKATTIRLFG